MKHAIAPVKKIGIKTASACFINLKNNYSNENKK